MATRKSVPTHLRLYTSREFLAATRLSRWQLRGWLREGVLSPPIGRGPGTRYTDEHIADARRAREVLATARSYRQAKEVLEAERARRAGVVASPVPAPAPREDAPAGDAPLGEAWEMVGVLPGVVIGVARSASPEVRRVVRRMLAVAGLAGLAGVG